jgi:hypothetical protein
MIAEWLYYSAVTAGGVLAIVTFLLGREYGEHKILEALKKGNVKELLDK